MFLVIKVITTEGFRKDTLIRQAFRECLTFLNIEHFPTHIIRSIKVQDTQDHKLCKKPVDQTNLDRFLSRKNGKECKVLENVIVQQCGKYIKPTVSYVAIKIIKVV